MDELKIALAIAVLEGVKWIFRAFKTGDDDDKHGHTVDASVFDGDLCRHGKDLEKRQSDSESENNSEHKLFEYRLNELAKEVGASGMKMDDILKVMNQMVGRLSRETYSKNPEGF